MPLLLRLLTPLLRLLRPRLLRPRLLRPRLLTPLPRLLTPLPRLLTPLPRLLTPLPLRLLKARRSNRLPAQAGRKGPPHGGPFF